MVDARDFLQRRGTVEHVGLSGQRSGHHRGVGRDQGLGFGLRLHVEDEEPTESVVLYENIGFCICLSFVISAHTSATGALISMT